MDNEKPEILLGLTTTPASYWRGKVEEMKKFGIKKIALFPTFLKIEERKELYKLLEGIDGLEIPHVHLRNDMDLDEIGYFIKKFQSKVFNIHPASNKFSFSKNLLKFADKAYVENIIDVPEINELSEYAGLCIDFSHWENEVLFANKEYDDLMLDRIKNFNIGCCHISAIKKESYLDKFELELQRFDDHEFAGLNEFDYIEKYKQYLPQYVSLELENSFEQQLEVKAYLERMLAI